MPNPVCVYLNAYAFRRREKHVHTLHHTLYLLWPCDYLQQRNMCSEYYQLSWWQGRLCLWWSCCYCIIKSGLLSNVRCFRPALSPLLFLVSVWPGMSATTRYQEVPEEVGRMVCSAAQGHVSYIFISFKASVDFFLGPNRQ